MQEISLSISTAIVEPTSPPVRGRVVRSRWLYSVLTFLTVFGPGLIVMEADNDAGAISTYVQAGAQYGTRLLWILLLLLPMAAWPLPVAMPSVDLQLVNFLTLVTEFAAISLALSHMNIAPKIGVPLSAVALTAMVLTGSYRRWERVTILLCLLDLSWLVVALKLRPSVGELLHNTVVPGIPAGGLTSSLVFLVVAIVGTTIAPWQLFFQQSCVADKRLRFTDLKWARLDTLLGAVFTIVVAACMMIAGNAAKMHGLGFTDPAQMASDLHPFSGEMIRSLILLLMINAAVLGTTAISLSSAWAYGEVKGWPHSLEMPVRKAPWFYVTYVMCVGLAAAVVLIPGAPLQLIILGVQVLAGIMLPSAIIFLQLLLNDKKVLGEQYVNKPWNNWVNWTIIIVLFVLSLILAAQVAAPNLFPAS